MTPPKNAPAETNPAGKIDAEMVSGWFVALALGIAAIDPDTLPAGLPVWVRPALGVFALVVAALNHSPRKAKGVKP